MSENHPVFTPARVDGRMTPAFVYPAGVPILPATQVCEVYGRPMRVSVPELAAMVARARAWSR